jgi:Pyridoxamine 5'-phosphate oxidase
MNATDLYHFLKKEKLGVVSSISPEGPPQSALVGIAVTEKLEIVFDTLDSTRKFRNLKQHPRCSFTIGWAGEITVQYEGKAWLPTGSELERYRQIYFASWPDGPSRLNWPGLVHFVVTPTWVRYSDFNQDPPLIEELHF